MSSVKPLPSANKPAETLQFQAADLCAPCGAYSKNPIDEYYELAQDLIVRISKLDSAADQMIMRLLVVELISGVELYVRRILSEVPLVCPIAERSVAGKTVSLGAVRYYPPEGLIRALTEHAALSGAKEIRTQIREVLCLEVTETSSEGVALAGFGRVCQLRHAAAHARGELGSQNAETLGLPSKTKRTRLAITPIGFQAIVGQTHTAVRALNDFVFKGTLSKWNKDGVLKGSWDADKTHFSKLFDLLVSRIDVTGTSAEDFHGQCVAALGLGQAGGA